jgi:hypothetical protein
MDCLAHQFWIGALLSFVKQAGISGSGKRCSFLTCYPSALSEIVSGSTNVLNMFRTSR